MVNKWDDIKVIAADVNSGKVTALSLVEKSLKLIEDSKEYNAVLWAAKDRALERAKDIDKNIAEGKSAGRLAGVPFIA